MRSRVSSNVDQLALALSRNRERLVAVADGEERARRRDALACVAEYVDLLGEASGEAAARYSFKLEFPDGRWNVAERELPVSPRIGELVVFEDGERWRIRDSQRVVPRPPSKPPREFFVCALAG